MYESSNGDRWYLARDSEDGRVFVQHQANISSGGRITDSDLGLFLNKDAHGTEHQELRRLIGALAEPAAEGSDRMRRCRSFRR